jgi:dihydroxyacetone kinase
LRVTLDATQGIAAGIEEYRRYPTKLGSEIGDGDHGPNIHRGLQAVLELLESAGRASLTADAATGKVATSGGSVEGLPGCCRSRVGSGDGAPIQWKLRREQEDPA